MTGFNEAKTFDVLYQVLAERKRQVEKWGEQHHPDGTGSEFADMARAARERCDLLHQAGLGTWADILSEEFWEALAEGDEEKLATELIQTAAVAVSWVEDIRSREAR